MINILGSLFQIVLMKRIFFLSFEAIDSNLEYNLTFGRTTDNTNERNVNYVNQNINSFDC